MSIILDKKLQLFIASLLLACPALSVVAQDSDSGFTGTIGASYEYGQLENEGMGLKKRKLTAISFEALPAWKLNTQWMIGVDLNYRLQQQQDSLASAGGTNLAGKGYLLGLGAQYRFNPKWALQGSLDFFGRYNFDRQTANAQDDHLKSPLGVRLKLQHFLHPNLSVDVSTAYTKWKTFHVGGVDMSEVSSQLMAGVGLTFHFDEKKKATNYEVKPEPPVKDTQTIIANPQEEISNILETEKLSNGYKLKLPSAAFASNKSELSDEFRTKLLAVGNVLAKTSQTVRVEGYTDNSGDISMNEKLSLARADAVKATLIESGLSISDIEAVGLGASNPIGDNNTREGRALNRRVEIEVKNK